MTYWFYKNEECSLIKKKKKFFKEYIKVQRRKLQIPQSPITRKEPASTDPMTETEYNNPDTLK